MIDRSSTLQIWSNIMDRIEKDNKNLDVKVTFNRSNLLDFAQNHYERCLQNGVTWNGMPPYPPAISIYLNVTDHAKPILGHQIRNAFQTALVLGRYERLAKIKVAGLTADEAMATGKKKLRVIKLTEVNFRSIAETSREFERYITSVRSEDTAVNDELRRDDYVVGRRAKQNYLGNPAPNFNLPTITREQRSMSPLMRDFMTTKEIMKTSETSVSPMNLSISPLSIDMNSWPLSITSLPPFLRDIVKFDKLHGSDAIWTCTPTGDTPIEKIPLTIAGRPVVIPVEYHYPVLATSIPPQDPHPHVIDCSNPISEDDINEIFDTFEHALGFYLLINDMLQIIIPDDFDYEYALSHQPISFGQLRVSYVRQSSASLVPTADRSTDATTSITRSTPNLSALATRPVSPSKLVQSPSSGDTLISTQTATSTKSKQESRNMMRLALGSMIQARVHKSKSSERFQGKIGLMTRVEDRLHLVVSSHVLTQALSAAKSDAFPGPNWTDDLTVIASNGSREASIPFHSSFHTTAAL